MTFRVIDERLNSSVDDIIVDDICRERKPFFLAVGKELFAFRTTLQAWTLHRAHFGQPIVVRTGVVKMYNNPFGGHPVDEVQSSATAKRPGSAILPPPANIKRPRPTNDQQHHEASSGWQPHVWTDSENNTPLLDRPSTPMPGLVYPTEPPRLAARWTGSLMPGVRHPVPLACRCGPHPFNGSQRMHVMPCNTRFSMRPRFPRPMAQRAWTQSNSDSFNQLRDCWCPTPNEHWHRIPRHMVRMPPTSMDAVGRPTPPPRHGYGTQ